MSPQDLTILGLVLGSPVLGYVANRYLRPKATPLEELQAIREDRAEDRVQLRLLADYVHQLRDHIAEEKGPPPPAWPEGLLK